MPRWKGKFKECRNSIVKREVLSRNRKTVAKGKRIREEKKGR